jgi:hypothetical protein
VNADLEIRPLGDRRYEVTIRQAGLSTRHDVTVPPALTADLGLRSQDGERIVRASFAFLLEREGPESILRRFDLDVIPRYFPEYLESIRSSLEPD